jgi:hypothetical protein
MPTAQAAIIPICCVCGLIREDADSSKTESWITKQVFRRTYRTELSEYRLTHTYCPTCYTDFMNRIAAA